MASREEQIRESFTTYVAAWNEIDAEKRVPLIAQCCTEDFRMVTAGRVIAGRAALNALVTEFRSRRPADRVRIKSRIEAHPSGSFRVVGVVEGPDGSVGEALDAGECDDEGRIRLLLTFASAAL